MKHRTQRPMTENVSVERTEDGVELIVYDYHEGVGATLSPDEARQVAAWLNLEADSEYVPPVKSP